jgi:sporulation protein YabP
LPAKELEPKKIVKDMPHTVVMQNRERLTITGVNDVESFNEEIISVSTNVGYVIVKGTGLHINKLSLDDGELMVEGYIDGLNYTDKIDSHGKTSGFLGKMFK